MSIEYNQAEFNNMNQSKLIILPFLTVNTHEEFSIRCNQQGYATIPRDYQYYDALNIRIKSEFTKNGRYSESFLNNLEKGVYGFMIYLISGYDDDQVIKSLLKSGVSSFNIKKIGLKQDKNLIEKLISDGNIVINYGKTFYDDVESYISKNVKKSVEYSDEIKSLPVINESIARSIDHKKRRIFKADLKVTMMRAPKYIKALNSKISGSNIYNNDLSYTREFINEADLILVERYCINEKCKDVLSEAVNIVNDKNKYEKFIKERKYDGESKLTPFRVKRFCFREPPMSIYAMTTIDAGQYEVSYTNFLKLLTYLTIMSVTNNDGIKLKSISAVVEQQLNVKVTVFETSLQNADCSLTNLVTTHNTFLSGGQLDIAIIGSKGAMKSTLSRLIKDYYNSDLSDNSNLIKQNLVIIDSDDYGKFLDQCLGYDGTMSYFERYVMDEILTKYSTDYNASINDDEIKAYLHFYMQVYQNEEIGISKYVNEVIEQSKLERPMMIYLAHNHLELSTLTGSFRQIQIAEMTNPLRVIENRINNNKNNLPADEAFLERKKWSEVFLYTSYEQANANTTKTTILNLLNMLNLNMTHFVDQLIRNELME